MLLELYLDWSFHCFSITLGIINIYLYMCINIYICVCVHACMRVCVNEIFICLCVNINFVYIIR